MPVLVPQMTERPGNPLTRQRSLWEPSRDVNHRTLEMLVEAGCTDIGIMVRRVHDGELTAIVTRNPPEFLWHMSISHNRRQLAKRQRGASRYPTWDEIADARYALLPAELEVVMKLPPPEEFVNVHDTTFHLHEQKRDDGA